MMKCVIVPLEGSSFEIDVSSCAKGEECLEKACQAIGVIESDYFGLQYNGPQGELLWLNSRNVLVREVPGATQQRFLLRVKFFVLPHLLLQESCRHQFFLQARADFEAHRLTSSSADLYQKAAAAVELCCRRRGSSAPTECMSHCCETDGCLQPSTAAGCYCCSLSSAAAPASGTAAHGHSTPALTTGRELASLEYAALKLLAQLDGYGYEWHQAAIVDRIDVPADRCSAADTLVAVGSEGITLHTDTNTHMIPFAAVIKITQKKQVLDIEYRLDFLAGSIGSGGGIDMLLLGLATNLACGALYRSITERHCFYRCDTVRSVVTDQYSLDLKGVLWSFLYSGSFLAKDFCFDVQRTRREAYDRARRQLFNVGAIASTFQSPNVSAAASGEVSDGCCLMDSVEMEASRGDTVDDCCVCLVSAASICFSPCRHRTCCEACSLGVDRCPICRSAIDSRQVDSCC